MSSGICRLCQNTAELQLSHVIPAFVFRWKRETAGGGYLRMGAAPNKRVQDGIQRNLLCAACEARFSQWEGLFAMFGELAFAPSVNKNSSRDHS